MPAATDVPADRTDLCAVFRLSRCVLFLYSAQDKEHRSHKHRADQQADHPVSQDAGEDVAHEADGGNRESIGELGRNMLDVVDICAGGRHDRGI